MFHNQTIEKKPKKTSKNINNAAFNKQKKKFEKKGSSLSLSSSTNSFRNHSNKSVVHRIGDACLAILGKK